MTILTKEKLRQFYETRKKTLQLQEEVYNIRDINILTAGSAISPWARPESPNVVPP